ncbi:30685_t:CDS:1, partial [Racocetra persica]
MKIFTNNFEGTSYSNLRSKNAPLKKFDVYSEDETKRFLTK